MEWLVPHITCQVKIKEFLPKDTPRLQITAGKKTSSPQPSFKSTHILDPTLSYPRELRGKCPIDEHMKWPGHILGKVSERGVGSSLDKVITKLEGCITFERLALFVGSLASYCHLLYLIIKLMS